MIKRPDQAQEAYSPARHAEIGVQLQLIDDFETKRPTSLIAGLQSGQSVIVNPWSLLHGCYRADLSGVAAESTIGDGGEYWMVGGNGPPLASTIIADSAAMASRRPSDADGASSALSFATSASR